MVVYLKANILLALSVVFIFLGTSSSTKFKITFEGYDVERICSETIDPKFCVKILESTPLTEQSDVLGLAKFLVNYGQHKISDAINQLRPVVIQKKLDPYSKKVFISCIEYLKWASTYSDNALKALANKDKDNFLDALFDVNNLADDIQDHLYLKGVKSVPGLMPKIGSFRNACDIAAVIINEFIF